MVYLGEEVSAWAVPAVSAVYNWGSRNSPARDQRARRAENFVLTFFDRLHKLDDGPGGYNDNWCDVDVGLPLEGWTRMSAAQDWLDRHPGARTAVCTPKSGAASPLLAEISTCRIFQDLMAQSGLTPEDLLRSPAHLALWLAAKSENC